MNLNELIQNAIDAGACLVAINKIKSYNTFEDAIQDKEAPYYAYWYAINVIKGRWPEMEHIILTSPQWSYHYAKNVINGRWEKCEKMLSSTSQREYYYYYSWYVYKLE